MHNLYELKEMLMRELEQIVVKGDISPQDIDKIKDATESIYYITAACAMEEGYDDYSGRSRSSYSNNYSNNMRRSGSYYGDNMYGETSGRRNSRGQYSRDGYSYHDLDSKRAYLEEMMGEARSESEREMFRKKLDELNRQM